MAHNNEVEPRLRLSMQKPLRRPAINSLDDEACSHIRKFIFTWLRSLHMPLTPWEDTLFSIAISISNKLFEGGFSQVSSESELWIQFISTNSPADSKFLLNVTHGELLQENEHNAGIPLTGTIRIYGVTDVAVSSKLKYILQALAYVAYSLYLEAYIMRDSSVQMMSNEALKYLAANSEGTLTPLTEQTATRTEKATENVISKWFKKLININHSNVKRRRDEDNKGDTFSKASDTFRRKLSLIASRKYSASSLKYSLTLLDQTEEQQGEATNEIVVISTSPSCFYPNPLNLTKSEMMHRNEDSTLIAEQVRPITERLNHKGPYQTTPDHTIKAFELTELYRLLKDPSLAADIRKSLNLLSMSSKSLDTFQQQQNIAFSFNYHPIGCPERPCLGPFTSKIDFFVYKTPKCSTDLYPSIDQTLETTIKHWYNICQLSCHDHIEELVRLVPNLIKVTPSNTVGQNAADSDSNGSSKSDRSTPEHQSSTTTETPGHNPSLTSTPYLSKTSPSKRLCSKVHKCSKPFVDHVLSFAHGKGRINVYISEDIQKTVINLTDEIVTWSTCHTCESATPPIYLSSQAASFSFAKYLELMFYSHTFTSASGLYCEHANTKNEIHRRVDRCFLYNGKVFKFIYEDLQTHTLSLPRTQLKGENMSFKSYNFSLNSPRVRYATLNNWKNRLATEDVANLFNSIDNHLNLLYQYAIAENKRRARDILHDISNAKKMHHETKSLDNELRHLRRRLNSDHCAIIDKLNGTSLNELNNFRIHYAIQARGIINYITDWQDEHCKEVADTLHWDGPDYIQSDTIHSFPGSSIFVRQNEPTSILAYTLTSTDYILELMHEEKLSNDKQRNSAQKNSTPVILRQAADDNKSLTDNTISMEHKSNDKQYNVEKPLPDLPISVIDGYYSSIERKLISPGSTTETASFRTMLTEIVRTSVPDVSFNNRQRLEELKARISPWSKQHEERSETAHANSISRQLVENTLEPLTTMQEPQHKTKEVSLVSVYGGNTPTVDSLENVSPHIKHKFVHNGIEFTCIVYYAREFDDLRKRYGVDDVMPESLSRCQTWSTSGGKSKSNFYKTQDDRFVVKEMVNAWNISERDAFLRFAPKYFAHLRTSAGEPSILAKIFGFFTVRVKTVADKKSILNMDLLVMEHLFFQRNIDRRFDFKGLQDRQVVEQQKNKNSTTLWDKDWLDELRMRMLATENSKAVMEIAIANDTEFLSKCNIMDYSLLVGTDMTNNEISVGIVDYIGAYTWYKMVESKSKSTLQRRKEVTVLPPEQYRERFIREVCDYFVSVPDKFDSVPQSKTLPSLLI